MIDALIAAANAHPALAAMACLDLLLLGVVIDLYRRDSKTTDKDQ